VTDPIEVVVFGRMVGEAILVRLAEEYWVAIDSFRVGKQPVALSYLARRGGDPRHIRAVLATHWHADHYRGLSEVLTAAPGARFLMPMVMGRRQLAELAALGVRAGRQRGRSAGSGFADVLRVLGATARSPEPVVVNHPIAEVDGHRLFALSPTTLAVEAGWTSLAEAVITEKGGSPYRPPGANETSVATFLRGPHCAVLGADLVAHAEYGWARAVVESSEQRDGQEASLLKVPHHGSKTADDDALWEHLLETPALGCVTSFSRASLPGIEDLARLRNRGCEPHIVATRERPAAIAALSAGVDPRIRTSVPGDAAVARFTPVAGVWRAAHCFLSEVSPP
jgi:hypothetical protein